MRDRIKSQKDVLLNAALEYIEDGWSVIPLNPHDKRPLNKWREFQDRIAEEEVVGWFDQHEEIALGLATGKTSNVVVIDCDSDSAIEFAKERGLTSPFSARSGRGPHYYFSHPGSDVRNQQGLWGCDDIDLRGDGGYVVVPRRSVNQKQDNTSNIDGTTSPVLTGMTTHHALPAACGRRQAGRRRASRSDKHRRRSRNSVQHSGSHR